MGGEGIVTPQEKLIIVDVYSYEKASTFTIWDCNEKCYKQSTTQKYDFVQLLHVLEHVGNPRNVLKSAMSFLKINGYLYVELPWEYENFKNVLSGNERIICSEHMNFFAPEVMAETLKSLGFTDINCKEGWVKMTHQIKPIRVIRCLSRLS